MTRRAARIDANQTEIVNVLRAAGLSVAITSAVGDGFPDLVVGGMTTRGERTWLLEAKDGSKPPSKRQLTEDQEDFHGRWLGQIATVRNAVEALCVTQRKDCARRLATGGCECGDVNSRPPEE